MLLEYIHSSKDVKQLTNDQLHTLVDEARAALLGAADPAPRTWAGGALIVLAALLSIRPVRRPRGPG